ncbi:MAG: hypothetical protein ACREPM_25825 [Gemmatimonadaceae bacterium]
MSEPVERFALARRGLPLPLASRATIRGAWLPAAARNRPERQPRAVAAPTPAPPEPSGDEPWLMEASELVPARTTEAPRAVSSPAPTEKVVIVKVPLDRSVWSSQRDPDVRRAAERRDQAPAAVGRVREADSARPTGPEHVAATTHEFLPGDRTPSIFRVRALPDDLVAAAESSTPRPTVGQPVPITPAGDRDASPAAHNAAAEARDVPPTLVTQPATVRSDDSSRTQMPVVVERMRRESRDDAIAPATDTAALRTPTAWQRESIRGETMGAPPFVTGPAPSAPVVDLAPLLALARASTDEIRIDRIAVTVQSAPTRSVAAPPAAPPGTAPAPPQSRPYRNPWASYFNRPD